MVLPRLARSIGEVPVPVKATSARLAPENIMKTMASGYGIILPPKMDPRNARQRFGGIE
jgi:hypothetical protein